MSPMHALLNDEGERMLPESADPHTLWEHIYRYRFAAGFAKGARIADIACGEGYGAAGLMEAGASSVIAIDASDAACQRARQRYGIDARKGDAEAIPLPDQSVDVVISFETIEHVRRPDVFLSECARILVPKGKLIISTPNRSVFAAIGRSSPFHCSEMTEEEFAALLGLHFRGVELYGQGPAFVTWRSPLTLAAMSASSPWFHLRGAMRIRDGLRSALCPHIVGKVSEDHRAMASRLILKRDRPFSSLVNPYPVRKRSSMDPGPMYAVAVCTS